MRTVRDPRHTRSGRMALVGALLLLTWPVPGPGPLGSVARAEATCTYEAGARSLHVEDTDELGFARDADGLILVDGSPLTGDCAGLTIHDVDAVTLAAQGRVTLDLRDGGLRHDDGTPVPVALELSGETDTLKVLATDEPGTIAAGTAGMDLTDDGVPDVTGLEGAETLELAMRSGDDEVMLRGGGGLGAAWSRPGWIDAGGGDDHVLGGEGPDVITGGLGEDELGGGRGDDRFEAGPVPDGPDLLQGGPGLDTADYGARTEDLALLLRMFDASGAPGEADSLVGIEVAIAGSGDDRLVGVGMNETLLGGPGDDEIRGGAGRDVLRGGRGADTLVGEREADRIRGEAGPDVLIGGDRADELTGGAGPDVLKGGPGRDVGSGGPGTDRCVSVERARSCETTVFLRPTAARSTDAATRTSDPALAWNTFLGGKADDTAAAAARLPEGGLVVVGTSAGSWGTPVRPFEGGGADAFVARLDATGHLLWSTFLGGPGQDVAADVAVAADGTVLVGGWSAASWGSPIRAFGGGASDGFVAALDGNGALLWHTFLGGDGRDRIAAVDAGGGSPVAVGTSGKTWGSPVRAFRGTTDVMAVQLDPGGALRWLTFVGGQGADQGFGVAVRPSGGAFVTGAASEAFGSPVRSYTAGEDALVAALDPDGRLQWVTFLGGLGADLARAVAVAPADAGALVAGRSGATWGAPMLAFAGRSDGLVARLDAAGSLLWNTFLGGPGWDEVAALRTRDDVAVFAVGTSSASWGEPQRSFTAGHDAFLAALGPAGRLGWLGFLGGRGRDDGAGLALGDLSVFVPGTSDASWGSPIRAFRGGWSDAFAAAVRSHLVDLTIGRSRETARGEVLRVRGERGEDVTAFIRVRNAGMARDAVLVDGCASASGFAVRYVRGEIDVSAEVLAGTYRTADLAPGRSTTLRLEVRIKRAAGIGDTFTCITLGTSASAPRVRDTVRLVVEVR